MPVLTDTAAGFLLLGTAMLVVLGIVFVVFQRGGPARERPKPPRGVHLPPPSFLPVVLSLGGALIGLGLVFRADDQVANLFLAIPGLVVFLGGCVAWIRAANHEWTDTERGPHGDGSH